MTLVIKISRSDRQWTAHVPKAKGLVAWSSSLKRLRGHVNASLKEFYPELAGLQRREVIDLPEATRALLKELAKAEKDVDRAARRGALRCFVAKQVIVCRTSCRSPFARSEI